MFFFKLVEKKKNVKINFHNTRMIHGSPFFFCVAVKIIKSLTSLRPCARKPTNLGYLYSDRTNPSL